MQSILILLILFVILVMPAMFTILNLYNLFSQHPTSQNFSIWGTLLAGYALTCLLYICMNFADYTETIYLNASSSFELHAPFSSQSAPVIAVLFLIAIASFLILHHKRLVLPPLLACILLSFVYLGCYISFVSLLQLLSNISLSVYGFLIGCLCLLPFNFLILTFTLLHELTKETWKYQESTHILTFFDLVDTFLMNSLSIPMLGFIVLIPVIAFCILIQVLFHQRPDELIRFVTDTSDWLFSRKDGVSVYVIQDDHYLCTVAAGGHPHIVKPQRCGIRQGHRIIVNRQLCIANAFEELIAQHTPHLHHAIRRFYDTYGFPVAKAIRTPFAADLTYLIMKPLEWLFLIVLYLCDTDPEKRIQRQYRIK